MADEFTGKTVLITGGASGIGRETARKFLDEGANVLITDLDEAAGIALLSELSSDNLLFHRHDVASEDDWHAVSAFLKEHFGPMDILVNSAGIAMTVSLEEMTLDQWRKQNAVNLDGTFLGIQAAVRQMRERRGSIVNLGSIASQVGLFSAVGYSAGKAAVLNLTRASALYCAQYGYDIRINAILPGYIDTPMLGNSFKGYPDPGKLIKRLKRMHPVGHFGTPADIAAGILFAASDRAKFMTGAGIPIDGGYLAQ